jgi:hypothetical protein
MNAIQNIFKRYGQQYSGIWRFSIPGAIRFSIIPISTRSFWGTPYPKKQKIPGKKKRDVKCNCCGHGLAFIAFLKPISRWGPIE